MSSYIKEVILNPWSKKSARNGNGRSANYNNSYDEKKVSYHYKKPNKYSGRPTSAVTIVHDPLEFYNGGFVCGAIFGEDEWERMRSSRVITENTIFEQSDRNGNLRTWRMVTLKCYDGRRIMKRASVEE